MNETIVILPGIGNTMINFQAHIDLIRTKGASCVYIEWPKFNKMDFNFDHHAEWLKNELEKLNISHAGFVGQSRGGLALIKFCRYYPKYVDFAIISNAPAGEGYNITNWILTLFIHLMISIPKPIYKFVIKHGTALGNKKIVSMAEFALKNEPEVLGYCYLDHIKRDWKKDIENIDAKIPLLFRYGKKDYWGKIAGNNAHKYCKTGKIVYDENGSHAPPSPDDLWRLILKCHNRMEA